MRESERVCVRERVRESVCEKKKREQQTESERQCVREIERE